MPHEFSQLENQGDPVPLICDVLAELNDSGDLTTKQIESTLGLKPRSGYAYTDRSIVNAQQLRQIFRASKSARAQKAILDYFADGTGWIATHIDADNDINGDGEINTDDILDGAIQANTDMAVLLAAAKTECDTGMKRIGSDRARRINVNINDAIQKLLAVQQVVSILSETGRS